MVIALFVSAFGGGVAINALATNQSSLLDYYYGGGPPPAPGTPSAPRFVGATPHCSSATVTWQPPTTDGASPILGYVIWVRVGNQLVTTANAGPSDTSATVTGLTNGTTYAITVSAVNAVGSGPESAPPVSVTPTCVPTTLTYTGDDFVTIGALLNISGLLASPNPTCTNNQPVSFSFDTNPITQTLGTFPLGTLTTAPGGQTPSSGVSTTGWKEGVYALTASFAGTSLCAPAQDFAAVTVAGPADQATGGGVINDNGRANFGFVVHLVPKTSNTFTGQVLFISKGKWRLKGTLSSYSKDSSGVGTATGTGDIYYGGGPWVLAQSGVTFTIKFTATGAKKNKPGTFGITINYTPVPPQPASPNTAPVNLKDGHIQMK
jgi:hypothetical protein